MPALLAGGRPGGPGCPGGPQRAPRDRAAPDADGDGLGPPTPPESTEPAPAGHRLRLAVAAAARDGDQEATAALVRQAPAHGLEVSELLAVAEAHWPKPHLHRRIFRAGRRWTAARLRRLHRPHRQSHVLAGRKPQR